VPYLSCLALTQGLGCTGRRTRAARLVVHSRKGAARMSRIQRSLAGWWVHRRRRLQSATSPHRCCSKPQNLLHCLALLQVDTYFPARLCRETNLLCTPGALRSPCMYHNLTAHCQCCLHQCMRDADAGVQSWPSLQACCSLRGGWSCPQEPQCTGTAPRHAPSNASPHSFSFCCLASASVACSPSSLVTHAGLLCECAVNAVLGGEGCRGTWGSHAPSCCLLARYK
jgi:hypothetical protein